MKIQERKKQFRTDCLNKLKRISKQKNAKIDKVIIEKIYKQIVAHGAENIMLFLPLKIEVNLYPLIQRLRKEKKNMYVPFMEGKSFRLVKYRLPLKTKKFGIKEPNDSKQVRNKKIDLAVVPIIGLDCTLRRVGFGKGMYDRFFEKEHKNIKRIVFITRKLCYSKEIVTNHYDVKANIIITHRERQRIGDVGANSRYHRCSIGYSHKLCLVKE